MRPRTASGRDAMLRTAAEAAVDAAMEQSGAQLGGMPPAAFITGLAGDLGAQSPAAREVLAVRWETCTHMSFPGASATEDQIIKASSWCCVCRCARREGRKHSTGDSGIESPRGAHRRVRCLQRAGLTGDFSIPHPSLSEVPPRSAGCRLSILV